MIVWFDSGSTWVLKVGSSFVKRLSALPIPSDDFVSFGMMASSMTGFGTYMDDIA